MSEIENQELVQYRFGKAIETINEAEFLLQNKYWNTTVNKLYYGCFYAASALLASINIYPKSHSGTQQMFSLHFIQTGIFGKDVIKFYTTLLDMRQDADYEDFVDYEENDVLPLIQPTKEFISGIQKMLFPA